MSHFVLGMKRYLVCDMAGHHFFVDAENEAVALRKAGREGAHLTDAVCVEVPEEREPSA